MSPTGKSFRLFVRACVRAKLRVPALRCCFRGWAAEARIVLPPGCGCVPANHSLVLRWPADRFKSLLIEAKSFPVATRCVHAAFRCVPAASRAPRARESMLICGSDFRRQLSPLVLSLPDASRAFPWLPVASSCFPLRSRCFPLRSSCFPRARINANLWQRSLAPVVAACLSVS